ncbi:MAG: acetolactate synthase, large subunit, biosynthetic type [Chloroflexi bacterium 13_1_40CM_3_65_12]|nr:MAG: acetolactate synthase, large subunit, biosynthetic type [Actinobacteria bacterium 13_1_40CM_4_65_12]OLD24762.1 MAG: acetolactate synthase, large subunit, biosynthetic type [Chloroflexi bacterium 13_1_40CM_3_65_12]OLD50659.1 MAG: acetolactate synthase, large subunit, biosynthetic type [Actinobacteria bacterium 13_1_40CM_2_65_8]
MVLEALEREGVELIFGYPGGANLPIYQRLPGHPKLKHILVRHEQGAAHMADGYARAGGKPGVVFATSGPGALNLVTGLCTAYMDSVPMIAITGQVNSTQVGRDAFQESDVIGATSSVTKHSYLVTRIDQLPRVIHEAFHIATTGRPGPVLIDICKDVQMAEAENVPPERLEIPGYKPNGHVDLERAQAAAIALGTAERPVVLAGHGVLLSHAEEALREFAERAAAPVGTTLLGIGAFPVKHPLSLHMTGFMGTGWNLKAVQNADVLMMVGMRVDDRVTARLADFAPKVKTFIHIDIDGSEMGKNVRPQIEVVADAKQALKAMLPHLPEPDKGRGTWLAQIDAWREEHPLRYAHSNGHLQPQDVLIDMYKRCRNEAIVVADVGQNQIWAALWWNYDRPGLFLNSGGSGTMGFALPAAIGAKFARPELPVWCVAGEGGFVMTAQELSVAVEHQLDVKIVLLNNFSLGMVRQFQDDFYGGVRSQVDLTHMPDFVKLSEAYGLPAVRVEKFADIAPAMDAAERTKGPFLIDFRIDPEAKVYPIVPLGKSLNEFWEAPEDA